MLNTLFNNRSVVSQTAKKILQDSWNYKKVPPCCSHQVLAGQIPAGIYHQVKSLYDQLTALRQAVMRPQGKTFKEVILNCQQYEEALLFVAEVGSQTNFSSSCKDFIRACYLCQLIVLYRYNHYLQWRQNSLLI